jgi:toxin ParE1/3/4
MTYKLAKAVRYDLQRIYDYGLDNWGEAAADTYYNALFDRFEEIASRPLFYPAVEHIRQGYRRSVCGVDSIYYRVDDDGIVEIMAVLGSQDTDEALKP